MYIMDGKISLKHPTFNQLFHGKEIKKLQQGLMIHCHRICSNCLDQFKNKGKNCKLCTNPSDIDYSVHYESILNL
jgi:predicted amidophosphoribosyltransferase